MASINLNVNGKKQVVDVDPKTPMLWVLRDHLNLVGTKFGCGMAACGACTILFEGTAVRSCQLPVSSAENKEITTIEGLSENGDHPVQKAWLIMSAVSLLNSNPHPTDEEIDSAMNGNICRCGTYVRIKAAIRTAASSIQ